MRAIFNLALKDLLLLWRDKAGMFWVLAFPLIMALFFGSIFSGGGGSSAIGVALIDLDQSDNSKVFVEELKKSEALKVNTALGLDSARNFVRKGNLTAYILVKKGFGESTFFSRSDSGGLELGIDPSRKAEAGFLEGLITQALFKPMQQMFSDPSKTQEMIDQQMSELSDDVVAQNPELSHLKEMFANLNSFMGEVDSTELNANSPMQGPDIEVVEVSRTGDRPKSSWEITFPQSIIWALIGCAAAFAISIVIERVRGTFLRLRLAPISKMQILLGKGLACFLACVMVMIAILGFGILVFGVRIGNSLHLLLAIVASAVCFVGVMMLISVLGKTENAVAGSGWGIMLIFSMTGGGMIPLLAMPDWMVKVSHFSPVKWSILAAEGAIWRSFSFNEMLLPLGVLISIGIVGFTIGVTILSKSDG